MAKYVRDLMNKQPIRLEASASASDAARQMKRANIGAVIVEEDGRACGIVTDRDIVVRAIADGKNPATTPLSDICSSVLATVSPDDSLDQAVEVMREKAIRRVLVVDPKQQAVGIVSLGDLAVDRDASSALGEISAAPPSP